MYVTRPMSRYLADPNAAAETVPDGPGSGFLVVVDEAFKEHASCCFGLSWDRRVKGLPFPQSGQLALKHSNSANPVVTGVEFLSEVVEKITQVPSGSRPPGGHTPAPTDYVVFVPVVGHSLSSGRYYVVQAAGKHTGKVFACSKEEDKWSCCCCTLVSDVKPMPFDSGDVYQQMEVAPSSGKKMSFRADAVATDGIPPEFLRNKGWSVAIHPKYQLADDAQGVNDALRRRMPPANLDDGAPPVVVGKWHVPFLFVRADGALPRIKDQAKKSTFYEMTLEQSWEQIFYQVSGGDDAGGTMKQEVAVTARVRRRTALLGGSHAVGSPSVEGGTVWFRPAAAAAGAAAVGLDKVVWERMEWEVEREGCSGGDGEERIQRVEKRDDAGMGKWGKFACYVLLERFVLRRMDRSVALTCEFRHAHKIRTNWA